MEKKAEKFTNKQELQLIFDQTFSAIHAALPQGIVRSNRPNSTPLVLFEAIAVGVADLLRSKRQLDAAKLNELLDNEQLKGLTTGATNSPPKLHARINFVSEHAHQ